MEDSTVVQPYSRRRDWLVVGLVCLVTILSVTVGVLGTSTAALKAQLDASERARMQMNAQVMPVVSDLGVFIRNGKQDPMFGHLFVKKGVPATRMLETKNQD
ncbi:hypothetical protein JNK13_05070 [bacterium]|nr:hypothetical protein [bacterium]